MAETILATTSKPPSQRCDKPSLIRLWVGKLALNAGQAITPTQMGVFESLWLEGLEDLPHDVLELAFRRTLQVCRYWPVKVSDIREQVDRATQVYAIEEAELKWTRVLDYIRVFWNPDLSGGASSRAPRIIPRTMHAIRCAGGLAEIADCPREHLHFKKELFLEAYTRWDALERDQFLLPDNSPVKVLIGAFASPSPETVAKIEGTAKRALALMASQEMESCKK